MTEFNLAIWRRTLRLGAVTSNEDTQFDATDEAFFHAIHDDSPVSERSVTLELEAHDREADHQPADPAESEHFRAHRARLRQTVVEIVATLALVSSTAFGMDLVRGSARAAGLSSTAPPALAGSCGRSDVTPVPAASRDPAPATHAAIRRYLPIAGERSIPGS